jgi:CRISPR-associated protein Cas4
MEEDYISISTLNDFIFCPYSIYLHNVYMDTDEGLFHAAPQTRGKIAHESVDNKTASTRGGDLLSLPVVSEKYGLVGKIDIYRGNEHKLIERKYQLKQNILIFSILLSVLFECLVLIFM